MKIYDKIEQGSDEWFDIRKQKLTASNATAIGNNGKGLETYVYNLMAEYYSSAEKEQYTNEDMERGNELEKLARGIYEFKNNVKIDEVGFIELDEYVGCSPDGLIEKDGGIEIKCLKDTVYFKALIEGIDVSKYMWQIQMCLYITGRKYWVLLIYNPNFKQGILTKTIYPKNEYIKKLKIGLETGKKKIKLIKSKIKKYEKSK